MGEGAELSAAQIPEPGSKIDYGEIGRENAERMRKRDAETTPLPPCPWCGSRLDQRDDEPVICENGCEKHPTLGPLGTREELWDAWNDHLAETPRS